VEKEGERSSSAEREVDWTAADAKRPVTFWAFNLGLCMFAMVGTAVAFHIVSIFETAGLDRGTAISIFLPSSIVAVSANALAGWLSDWRPFRDRLTLLLGIELLGVLLMCLGVWGLSAGWGRNAIIAGNGIASGLFGTLSAVAWPGFFGRTHLGAISGLNMAFVVFFSAIGPPVFGWSYSLTRSYSRAVMVCGTLTGMLLILSFGARKPEKPVASSVAQGR
jgi:hypothetical protein